MKSGKLEHSKTEYKGKRVGENLASFTATTKRNLADAGKTASNLWYKEIDLHDFAREFQTKSGHFTQLIWKSSKEAGFGFAKTKQGDMYVVAMYHPAGNVAKQFKENVSKPTSKYENEEDDDEEEDEEDLEEEYEDDLDEEDDDKEEEYDDDEAGI